VERLGHSMIGSGASFGFQTITDIGAALEREARSADADASRKWVSELSAYLDRVELAQVEGLGHGAEVTEGLPDSGTRTATVGGARRIVLVDDDAETGPLFRELLEQRGHEVKEARSGIEGVALILAEKPDVAIIDIDLHGMDGYEVARQVRAALGRSVRLVALTGYGTESDRVEARAAGFDAHVTKPVDIAQIEPMLQTSTTAVPK